MRQNHFQELSESFEGFNLAPEIIQGIIIISMFLCISSSFLVLLIYQTISKKRYTPHLLLGYIFVVLGSIFQLLTYILALYTYNSESRIIQGLVRFIFCIALYFVYLHYEALSNLTPPLYRNGTMISILTITFSILILNVSQNVLVPELEFFMFISYSLTVLFAISFAIIVTYKSYKLMHDKATAFELLALFILLFTFIHEVFALLGILILMGTSVYYRDYVYRLPVPVHDFLIYSSSGLLVYSRTVKIPGINLVLEKQLISGMFTAIASLIKETLGSDSILLQIDVNNYQIYFSVMPNKQGTLAVIAAKGTFFLKQSIKRFVLSITEELNQKINESIVDTVELAKELDLLLHQSFPYLVLVNA